MLKRNAINIVIASLILLPAALRFAYEYSTTQSALETTVSSASLKSNFIGDADSDFYEIHPTYSKFETAFVVDKLGKTDILKTVSPTDDLSWLTINSFFEARNQKIDVDIVGTMFATKHRVGRFGSNIFEVVMNAEKDSHGNLIQNHCHYSWVCDNKQKLVVSEVEKPVFYKIKTLATKVLSGKIKDPTGGADHYHKTDMIAWWAKLDRFIPTKILGSHIYYKDMGEKFVPTKKQIEDKTKMMAKLKINGRISA